MQEKALEIDTQALPDNHESLVTSYMSLATTYLHLKDLTKALYYAEKGLRMLPRLQTNFDPLTVAGFQLVLGSIQYELNNNIKALKMAEKALNNALASSLKGKSVLPQVYALFSLIHEKDGDSQKALEYTEKAIELMKGLEDT